MTRRVAETRWFLAYTLIKNPRLIAHRKRYMQQREEKADISSQYASSESFHAINEMKSASDGNISLTEIHQLDQQSKGLKREHSKSMINRRASSQNNDNSEWIDYKSVASLTKQSSPSLRV